MDAESWKKHIQFFLTPHPVYHEAGEDMYVPREGYTVASIFTGGLRIVGDTETLEVNYNNPDLLILSLNTTATSHIYRFDWDHLVAFELVRDNEADDDLPWPPRISMN
ncbi:hypothetical protein [Rhodopirellula bahusiensis]|uniref:Uncharacterized protein n=1 Tax=Rhodopirellula bahusiensis TaxID=2014065 RepID=A0A2G1WA14_9BACT|nr:hypothetical protein [Rhodopirellula bahusiensis]PHQ35863.1 hypothetical protein CEE69_07760 [Rhodopirellula bahusiensis]